MKFLFAILMAFITAIIQFYTADFLQDLKPKKVKTDFTITRTYSSMLDWR